MSSGLSPEQMGLSDEEIKFKAPETGRNQEVEKIPEYSQVEANLREEIAKQIKERDKLADKTLKDINTAKEQGADVLFAAHDFVPIVGDKSTKDIQMGVAESAYTFEEKGNDPNFLAGKLNAEFPKLSREEQDDYREKSKQMRGRDAFTAEIYIKMALENLKNLNEKAGVESAGKLAENLENERKYNGLEKGVDFISHAKMKPEAMRLQVRYANTLEAARRGIIKKEEVWPIVKKEAEKLGIK